MRLPKQRRRLLPQVVEARPVDALVLRHVLTHHFHSNRKSLFLQTFFSPNMENSA